MLSGCGDQEETGGEVAGSEGGEMGGGEGGEVGGSEGGEVGGSEGGEMGGSDGGEMGGEEGGAMGGEEEPSCASCTTDEDCERGQTCVAMDPENEVMRCFSPCFDDGTCGGDGENCVTLSHELTLYICSPEGCDDYCYDQDGDGYGTGPGCVANDCNDSEALINEGMSDDVCDGVDNDCNGLVDDDFPGQCPAPSWRLLNETALEDRWVIYEAVFYRDAACTEALGNVEAIFSSVGNEEMEALLFDQVIDPIEALPWLGGVVDEAAPNASFVGYTFTEAVEVGCVDLYQSDDPTQRLIATRLQSGFDGVWNTNTLMAGEDMMDTEGYSFTRFHPSVCGDGVVSSLEECDSEEPVCEACRLVVVGQGEPCFANEQTLAVCDEGLACMMMDGEGQCLPPMILIEEEYCDPDDPTAICGEGLTCLENDRGAFVCTP